MAHHWSSANAHASCATSTNGSPGLPLGLEATILVAGTFCVGFATCEIVRRVNLLRPLFGLKALPREPARELATV